MRPHPWIWKEHEIEYLKQNYAFLSNEEIKIELNKLNNQNNFNPQRSVLAIAKKASKLKLKKIIKKIKPYDFNKTSEEYYKLKQLKKMINP